MARFQPLQELLQIVVIAAGFGAAMAAYRAQTEPLLPYYRARGVLKTVEGMAAMDEVYRQIRAVLAGA